MKRPSTYTEQMKMEKNDPGAPSCSVFWIPFAFQHLFFFVFHLVTNLTKVLSWALKGLRICDVLEYAVSDTTAQKWWQVVIELFL